MQRWRTITESIDNEMSRIASRGGVQWEIASAVFAELAAMIIVWQPELRDAALTKQQGEQILNRYLELGLNAE